MALGVCPTVPGLADTKKVEKLSCTQLAAKAVEISKDKMVSLIKVRKLKVRKDNYTSYKLPTVTRSH